MNYKGQQLPLVQRQPDYVSFFMQDNAKPVRPGETIYKGHHSYDLMRNLQLGIIFSIAKSVEQAAGGGLRSPVQEEDFAHQVWHLHKHWLQPCQNHCTSALHLDCGLWIAKRPSEWQDFFKTDLAIFYQAEQFEQ